MRPSISFTVFCIVVLFESISQVYSQTTTTTTTTTATATIALNEYGYAPTNTYNYSTQGSAWRDSFTYCGGLEQSPIDITSVTGTCDSSMVFNLQLGSNITFNMTNTSYTIQGSGASFGQLYATDVNGNLLGYNSTMWRLHSPSEHTLQGQSYDAELQFIFDLMSSFTPVANRTKAVVSFLLTTNSNTTTNTSSVLTPFNLGTNKTTNVTLNFSTLIQGAIPLSDSGTVLYYTYQGSLTAPPCNETVNWYVISGALPISQTDLAYMNTLWMANSTFAAASGYGNNRAIQPLNTRTIKQGGVACEEQFVYFFSFFILYIIINYFIFKLL